jgi:hypothetical protein
MKKRIIIGSAIALFALFTAGPISAQEDNNNDDLKVGEFGLLYLPTFTKLDLNTYNGEVVEGTATLSHGYGAMLGLNMSKNVGLRLEGNYIGIMQKYKDRDLEREVHINYLNFPLMLTLSTDKTKPVNFNVMLGPQFGLNVGSKITGDDGGDEDTLHAVIAVKEGDVGVAYGAGFEIALIPDHSVRLDFGFRGMYGLVDMRGDKIDPNTYNVVVKGSRKSYGGYLGVTFGF